MATRKFRKVERFDAVDKQQIKGRVGHTRTGACTAKGRCYHGRIPTVGTTTHARGHPKTSPPATRVRGHRARGQGRLVGTATNPAVPTRRLLSLVHAGQSRVRPAR